MRFLAAFTEQPFVAIQVTATFLNFGVLAAAAWMIKSQGERFRELVSGQDRRIEDHDRRLELLDRDTVKKEDWLRVSNRTDHKVDKLSEQMAAIRQAVIGGGCKLDEK